MIERKGKQIGRKLRRDSVQEYFNTIDINHTGKIKSEAFIHLLNLKGTQEDPILDFFNSFHDFEATSKSEIIIKKLKAIKENKNLAGDFQALDDLDWYS